MGLVSAVARSSELTASCCLSVAAAVERAAADAVPDAGLRLLSIDSNGTAKDQINEIRKVKQTVYFGFFN